MLPIQLAIYLERYKCMSDGEVDLSQTMVKIAEGIGYRVWIKSYGQGQGQVMIKARVKLM